MVSASTIIIATNKRQSRVRANRPRTPLPPPLPPNMPPTSSSTLILTPLVAVKGKNANVQRRSPPLMVYKPVKKPEPEPFINPFINNGSGNKKNMYSADIWNFKLFLTMEQ